MVESERPHMTIWRRVEWWIIKATHARAHAHAITSPPPPPQTHTHTQNYVILIVFPQQQLFREGALMLCYTHVACFVEINFGARA
jgi:hypothetical protein